MSKDESQTDTSVKKSAKMTPGTKLRDADKMAHIPIKVVSSTKESMLRKPSWLRIKLPRSSERIDSIKANLRKHNLHSVCEEASCPNLSECFNHGTATFMILGDICTRRCPFCDVGHGRPLAVDTDEPKKLALSLKDMALKYVVITSVDRDDLADGGADQFVQVIKAIRDRSPQTTIEILTPDFRNKPGATNVLSWPSEELAADLPGGVPDSPAPDFTGEIALGDIAISFDTCAREAKDAAKLMGDHVRHLILHGVLHLLGYDHIRDLDATLMEAVEVEILGKMGVDNPYIENDGPETGRNG